MTGDSEAWPASVVVVGLGLMGGSLARTLRARGEGLRILGIDVDPIRGARARDEGVVDAFGLAGDGLAAQADLVVLACPLGAARRFLVDEAGGLAPGTLFTDVVSLNQPLLDAAARADLEGRTVTAHPMCGSHASGFAAARDDLYLGARNWLSAGPDASPAVRRRIQSFWESVGTETEWIDAREHDRTMAWVSHLPQLVANALAGALDAAGIRPSDLGPGGRDMTRLAASSPELWRELLEASAPSTGAGLTSVSRALDVLGNLLARRDLDSIQEFMARTRRWAMDEEGEP